MYINSLGMRDEVKHYNAVNTQNVKNTNAVTSNNGSFPTAIKQAVESQSTALYEDTELSQRVGEALERLKNDPEWEDVGTALSALYKNQQQMQVKMNLMSAGYAGGLTGLSTYSKYGLGTNASAAYSGLSSLLGSSIFANQLI